MASWALTALFPSLEKGDSALPMLPIIASNFPVWKLLVENQGVGICVDRNNNLQIQQARDWLYDNPEKASEMGRRGKIFVLKKYNWNSQAKNLLELYNRRGQQL
jgi:glycosyltransferase involved in cell wall biosynthesis